MKTSAKNLNREDQVYDLDYRNLREWPTRRVTLSLSWEIKFQVEQCHNKNITKRKYCSITFLNAHNF